MASGLSHISIFGVRLSVFHALATKPAGKIRHSSHLSQLYISHI